MATGWSLGWKTNFWARLLDGNHAFQIIKNMLHLLPALPDAWQEGEVRGLRARGGFIVDEQWSGGQLQKATIRSTMGDTHRIRSSWGELELETSPGKTYHFTPASFQPKTVSLGKGAI